MFQLWNFCHGALSLRHLNPPEIQVTIALVLAMVPSQMTCVVLGEAISCGLLFGSQVF